MAKVKLTAKAVEALKAPTDKLQADVFDTVMGGFGVRVSRGGTKTYFMFVRINGKLTRLSLGRAKVGGGSGLTLAEARAKAGEWSEVAAAGGDPRQIREAEKEAEQETRANTFGVVADKFLDRYVARQCRPATAKEYRRALQGADVEAWRGRPLADITRRDVHDLLDRMVDRGAETMANRTLAYLKRFFGWAAERGIIEVVPTDRVKPPTRNVRRDRWLDDTEIADVWAGCEAIGHPFGGLFRVMLLTGQRESEVAGMQWSEIKDLKGEAPEWHLPANRTKNGLPHVVPLTAPVVEILSAVPRMAASAFVWTTTGRTSVTGFSKGKARLDAAIADRREADSRDPMPAFVLHDLRRTMSTHMHDKLGILPHVVEATINHISGAKAGVAGTYNWAAYMPDRRAALERWAAHVMMLVAT